MPRRLAKYQAITGFFSGWEMKMKINHHALMPRNDAIAHLHTESRTYFRAIVYPRAICRVVMDE